MFQPKFFLLLPVYLTALLAAISTNAATDAASANTSTLAPSVSSFAKPLAKGRWQLGGGLNYSESNYKSQQSNSTTRSTFYRISPQAEYFLSDNFSLGGTLAAFGSKGDDTAEYTGASVGPSATYYFAEEGNIAFYGAQSFNFIKYSDDTKTYQEGTSGLGARYFFSRTAAFGMGLDYNYSLNNGGGNDNRLSVLGSFSVYY